LPDFPAYDWRPNWQTATKYPSDDGPWESIYNTIEEREPGTSSWINILGAKIGGFPHFEQGNPVPRWSADFPGVAWHFIASYIGPVSLGDAGILNVLAGRDARSGEWIWQCYWECG
jgi:hypothetical protein